MVLNLFIINPCNLFRQWTFFMYSDCDILNWALQGSVVLVV